MTDWQTPVAMFLIVTLILTAESALFEVPFSPTMWGVFTGALVALLGVVLTIPIRDKE